ncbi:dihydrolipoamide acetyltransferase family protein [Solitalea canadensis]|uniref:Dihydrolipoamide acetyltransferase component of pyruvate dehydrogenase complex n=1 Tax=Solitalea canadensis (strain ATCC 29591 / DSM 3403 / JCM 21819 / LMG 8368 / NBRC 15130 / NCIMB 12057 / USAM 9D) TaxID=929556 RepID=H8KQQ7_SOLCM|nr:dihydrolipoamide acetyltransferase family protein [Solitalea canadensis]AFD06928.1 pyruvate/2-oxoglutarate dehydrogenase complex, dihydrolipoamide acyltransferase component [Solitalea canadensis DSM 3403]
MARYELIMPKMGESVAEATIIKWVKNIGDRIEADENVLEIATDKVDSEVPSPVSGTLVETLFSQDDVVQVGATIAIIETEGGVSSSVSDAQPEPAVHIEEPQSAELPDMNLVNATLGRSDEAPAPVKSNGIRFYSPLVRNIAESEGISGTELDSIVGTGSEGRVTKQDILAYVQQKAAGTIATPSVSAPAPQVAPVKETPAAPVQPQKAATPAIEIKAPAVSVGGADEIIEMDRMRKLIAEHMVMSKHVSPHVTSFVEADVTNIVLWRDKVKKTFEKREGEKITFTPIFIEAVAKAIKDLPMINVSVDGTKIIVRKNINIGMATALPSGNLIVPVIKNADQMNLVGLTKSVNDLANRARNNKLQPDEIQGGTFTLTNVGSFGNVMGTPIINQPQAAIMAVGAIKKKPAVIETEFGDVIAIRHMMFLSLSYDHRVVDGSLGGMFVRKVADYLEAFDPNRDI